MLFVRSTFLMVGLIAVLIVPAVVAQFGVAGGRRRGEATSFQDLQEKAKALKQDGSASADVGDMLEKMQKMLMADPKSDPDAYMAKIGELGEMGAQFNEVLESFLSMTPEEIHEQMTQGMQLMADDKIVDQILANRDEVLQSLEASGEVPPEEMAKFKTDPKYFERKMRETFNSLGKLFTDPEYIAKSSKAMYNLASMMKSPETMENVMKMMSPDFLGDEKNLEEARLQLIQGEGALAGLANSGIFDAPEMKEIINDPVKWREMVQSGMAGLIGMNNNGDIKDEL